MEPMHQHLVRDQTSTGPDRANQEPKPDSENNYSLENPDWLRGLLGCLQYSSVFLKCRKNVCLLPHDTPQKCTGIPGNQNIWPGWVVVQVLHVKKCSNKEQ